MCKVPWCAWSAPGLGLRELCSPLKFFGPKAQESFVEWGARRELVRWTDVFRACRGRCQRGMSREIWCPKLVASGGTEKQVQRRAHCFLCSPLYVLLLDLYSLAGLLISLPGTGINSLLYPQYLEQCSGGGRCAGSGRSGFEWNPYKICSLGAAQGWWYPGAHQTCRKSILQRKLRHDCSRASGSMCNFPLIVPGTVATVIMAVPCRYLSTNSKRSFAVEILFNRRSGFCWTLSTATNCFKKKKVF